VVWACESLYISHELRRILLIDRDMAFLSYLSHTETNTMQMGVIRVLSKYVTGVNICTGAVCLSMRMSLPTKIEPIATIIAITTKSPVPL
jgi:hypothetical protein